MSRLGVVLVVALLASGSGAWAHDGAEDPKCHTHWWIGFWDFLPDSAWYAGASLTQSTLGDDAFLNDGSYTSESNDDTPTGYRLFGGISWRYVAIEVGYVDIGEASYAAQSDGSGFIWNAGPVRQDIAVDGFDASLVGRVPIREAWTLSARAGLFKSDVETRFVGDAQCCGATDFRSSNTNSDLLYGIGIERALGNWKVGAAYQATRIGDDFSFEEVDLTSLSLSVAYDWGGSPQR